VLKNIKMKKEKKLNVDIAGSINELQSIMKEFSLKKEIYKIVFRGKGLEFEGYRNFTPEDDANIIDWKSSAKAQKLLVKQYKEERDLKIMFLIDVSDNMVFGSTEKIKCEFMAELATAFAYIMINSNDSIGFYLFSDTMEYFIDCKRGQKHFQFFSDMLSNASSYGGKQNINKALDLALEYLDDSISVVVLLSDFLEVTKETEKKLTLLSNRFETISLRIRDPLDLALPEIEGEIVLEDSSTHEQIIINPKIAGKTYQRYALEQERAVEEMFKKSGVDCLNLITDKSFVEPLTTFLKERMQKKF